MASMYAKLGGKTFNHWFLCNGLFQMIVSAIFHNENTVSIRFKIAQVTVLQVLYMYT